MANLTRTFTGDLSSFIAGKVFDRVKEMMDDRKERESDPRVKKAAKKLEEKQVLDPESIPVVDDRLRQQVTKLFGSKIEARLFNLEASVDRTNAAITTIAAGIGDTQELIVNQNQILEDKFDKLLDVLGTNKDVEKKNLEKLKAENEAQEIFDQKQMFGSQALLEAVAASSYLTGSLLGFLVRRSLATAGKKLLRRTSRRFIPKNIRARGRFLRSIVDGSRRQLSKSLGRKSADKVFRSIIKKEFVEKTFKASSKRAVTAIGADLGTKGIAKVAGKKVPVVGAFVGAAFAIERLIKGDTEGAALELASGLASILPYIGTGSSFAIDAYLIRRDIEREFTEAGYASGTGRTSKGPATLHGKELILGRKDMDDISLGFKNAIMGIGTVLTSVSLDVASAAGAEPEVRSLMVSEGLNNFNSSPFQYNADIGKVKTKNLDIQAIDKIASNDLTLPFLSTENNRTSDDEEKKDRWWIDPRGWFNRGGSGSSIDSNNESLIDASGEPGVDFTPTGTDNRALFDGQVVEIGYQFNPKTQRGYGNYVVVRSEDPKNGELFDALYAHIPKNAIYVNKGDQLKVGDKIGRMGTENDDITDIGSINGTHMSVDFLKPGSSEAYPFWRTNIVPLVDTKFSKAKLKTKKVNPDLKTASMEMLAAYEDIKLNAYDDGTGIWTIGFGATRIRDPITGKMRDVREGDTITEEQAYAMKDADYQRHYDIAEKELNAQGLSLRDLPVHVAAPLISLAFNYGSLRGAHNGSTSKWMIRGKEVTFPHSLPVMIKNAHKTGDYSKIADLLNFNLSQDQDGLNTNRRQSEAAIIKSGTDDDNFFDLHNLDLLGNQSFSPSLRNNLLVQKMGDDSQNMEDIFDKVNGAGTPIYVLNTNVVSTQSNKTLITRSVIDTNWKEQYRIASLS